MIETIFENLFKPVSEEEFSTRNSEWFPVIEQFETRVKRATSVDETYAIVNEFYMSSTLEGPNWWGLYYVMMDAAPTGVSPETARLFRAYQQWKNKK